MKKIFVLFSILALLVFPYCSEDTMDNINKDRNNAADIMAKLMLPHVIVESAAGTTATDMAWYASVYVEHNAGTHGQLRTADQRVNTNESSLFNNSWNNLYQSALMPANDIIKKCSPDGSEPANKLLLGIAQVLMAYNWAVTTDMWGPVPCTEALQGSLNRTPAYDKQQAIYGTIQTLLDNAITNLAASTSNTVGIYDYIYAGNATSWTKAAWGLKARYYLRLSARDAEAATKALDAASKSFKSAGEEFKFIKYEATAIGENPWYQFSIDRTQHSVGKTLFDLMKTRTDPRMAYFFTQKDGEYKPAPNGTAEETQGALYSVSKLSSNKTAVTPLMSYHELKFIEAEAKARKNDATYKDALQAAITASFAFHKVTESATDYFTNVVTPLLGAAANDATTLKEILTQKYIAFYEHESMEAYNDYRRTGIPTLNNPNNAAQNYGFVWRFPYPTTEESSNKDNVPAINVFKDKVWWAGGAE